jgi:hypothetical protein
MASVTSLSEALGETIRDGDTEPNPDPESKELTLTRPHPGAEVDGARQATGWGRAPSAFALIAA